MERWVEWGWCIVMGIALVPQLLEEAYAEQCDYFRGSWVFLEDDYSDLCPFVGREFSCFKNGRPDLMYLNYTWQPTACNLTRFDGVDLLEKLRGKRMMFVGDSISRNQWASLACMLLYSRKPLYKYMLSRQDDTLTTLTFTEYDAKIMLNRNHYLVDIVNGTEGRILKLDSVENGAPLWKHIDILIFNTWHWWYRRGSAQPWDYIEVGNKTYRDMDRMAAFETALHTWASWVDHSIDPSKQTVFFQGISPSHYNGSEWNEVGATSCAGEKEPVRGSTYPGGSPPALAVLKRVLMSRMVKKTVTLLDITTLSQLRKDGHPSIYGLNGNFRMDCTHWCLPGVPDAWNLILYNLLL